MQNKKLYLVALYFLEKKHGLLVIYKKINLIFKKNHAKIFVFGDSEKVYIEKF